MLPSSQPESPEKCTCGATLAENARFCHRCGRPVNEMTPAELNELFPTPSPDPTPVATPPRPMPIGWSNPVAMRVAIMMSLAITMVSLMPYLILLSFFWWIAAGWGAVWFYRRLTGVELSVSSGARLGFLTGFFTFVGLALLIALMLSSSGLRDEAVRQMATQHPDYAEALKNPGTLWSAMLMASPLLFALVSGICAAGGALGAKFGAPEPKA
jgi:hypothetical protein